ncbi:MAG: GNAT family N-acetyltransferase [Betaproteobacteria bacterium]
MTPIFDADTRLVAWFDGQYLFDLANDWVAFHDRGNVFSTAGAWLGPLSHGSFLDREGRPVGWLAVPGARPTGGLRPSAPMNAMRPLPPKRPLHPRTPLPPGRPLPPSEGWSALTWLQWVGKAPVAEAALVDVASLGIEPITEPDFDAFFLYLGEQLAENGRDGVYFQPMARTDGGVPAARQQAFREAVGVAVGEPGWRRGWIARDARGRVAGHIDLRAHADPFTGHRCQLGMGVQRDFRRIGLARRLLAHATHWAGGQGLKWIDLQVLSSNEPAVALYRREGFLIQGGKPDMFVIDGVSLGEVTMARKVSPST